MIFKKTMNWPYSEAGETRMFGDLTGIPGDFTADSDYHHRELSTAIRRADRHLGKITASIGTFTRKRPS
jgi:hypothetical protein